MNDRVWLISYWDNSALIKAMKSPLNAIGNIPVMLGIWSEVPIDDQGEPEGFAILSVTILSNMEIDPLSFEDNLYNLFSKYGEIVDITTEDIIIEGDAREIDTDVGFVLFRLREPEMIDIIINKSKEGINKKKIILKKLPNNRILSKSHIDFKEIVQWLEQLLGPLNSRVISTSTILYLPPSYVSIPTSYISKLRNDKASSDLMIRVNYITFNVHRSIIYSASTFFSYHLSDPTNSDIILENIDPVIFSLLLDLIYGLKIPADHQEIINVLNMVILFDVEGLNWEETIPKLSGPKDKILQLINLVYPEGNIPYLISEYIKSSHNFIL